MLKNNSSGFTLIEIAIVLLIVSILLGYTVAMAPRQLELQQFKKAKQEMTQIQDAIYAFAQVNGYLPCPAEYTEATNTSISKGFEYRTDGTAWDGTEDPSLDTCAAFYGAVPGKTLGITGKYSDTGLLLDSWGNPYGYSVTNTDCEENSLTPNNTCTDNGADPDDGDGLADFVISGAIKNVTMVSLDPDLRVCSKYTGTTSNCGGVGEQIIINAPVVIWSKGKNRKTSTFQDENTDGDEIYISTSFSDSFDDIVRWISPNILYSKMIESGQLP